MTNAHKTEATLKCTKCGHSVPPPAESTSDENSHRLSGLRSESRNMGQCEKGDRLRPGFCLKPQLPLAVAFHCRVKAADVS